MEGGSGIERSHELQDRTAGIGIGIVYGNGDGYG
jgi:hypothetical protein